MKNGEYSIHPKVHLEFVLQNHQDQLPPTSQLVSVQCSPGVFKVICCHGYWSAIVMYMLIVDVNLIFSCNCYMPYYMLLVYFCEYYSSDLYRYTMISWLVDWFNSKIDIPAWFEFWIKEFGSHDDCQTPSYVKEKV